MCGAGSYWAERIQFKKDQYTEITKKQGIGISYYGDGPIFFTSKMTDYMCTHIVNMYVRYVATYVIFTTLYKLHRHVYPGTFAKVPWYPGTLAGYMSF